MMKWWNWFWRNKDGKVVVWQTPNLPLFGWAVCRILAYFIDGRIETALSILGTLFLIIWSLVELFKGSSPFRKTLGAIVLILTISSLF